MLRRMASFPDPPAPAARPEPEQTALPGPLGGPSYGYRGTVIDCQKGGHVCVMKMPEHPLRAPCPVASLSEQDEA